jgi:hypothetical protein
LLPLDPGKGNRPEMRPDDPAAEESRRGVHGRILSHLRGAGIDVSQPLELLVNVRQGTIDVMGQHPDGEAAEDALRRIPRLDDLWRKISARDVFAVKISDYALDPIL